MEFGIVFHKFFNCKILSFCFYHKYAVFIKYFWGWRAIVRMGARIICAP